jgi:alkyldihydroxyacetonephosphate synthase
VRRWNGWGHASVSYPLPDATAAVLAERIGPGSPPRDALLAEVTASVPPSRLPAHPLVTTDPEVRVRHSRGQSFPDLIVLRSGRVPAFPDGVAFPRDSEDVRALFSYAREVGARLIPYGGGTSVVGHVNVAPGDAPILTVSLERLQQLHSLSEEDRLATFGAGVSGPRLEEALRARGYTLGHFPQSFELSTLGGWIVTRSRGQQSLGYGRIEDMFAGGRLESPSGTLELPHFPASATGPDLREFVLAGHPRMVGLLSGALSLRGVGSDGCMLVLGVSGSERTVEFARRTALGITRAHGGVRTPLLGQKWFKGRFRAPYLRNAAWERGWGVDTVETATSWSNVPRLLTAVEDALRGALAERGEQVLAFTHLSQVYPTGSNLSTTFIFRLGTDAEDTHARWLALKTAASRAMVSHGGTISHQHGVGTDHRPWLEAEKGQLGITAIRHVLGAFDPAGLLNPGKLV